MPNYRVTVDGRTYDVRVPDPLERPVRAIVDGKVYEVHVEGEPVAPSVPSAPVTRVEPVAVASPPPPSVVAVPLSTSGATSEVTAPLPGTIVSISVAEGDAIAFGQELCVLEAMKMNNPIRATQAGQVSKILVGIGQQVQHGESLMVVVEA